jgi:hypothetical protein
LPRDATTVICAKHCCARQKSRLKNGASSICHCAN